MRNSVVFSLFFHLILFKINAQSTTNGSIIANDGTQTEVTILKKSKSNSDSSYYFDYLNLSDKNGIFKKIYPADTKGFKLKNRTFVTKKIELGSKVMFIFCEELVKGNATLFYYKGLYSPDDEIYIFNRKSDPSTYLIRTVSENKRSFAYSDNVPLGMPSDLNHQKQVNDLILGITNDKAFEQYFTRYFGDCDLIRNKIKQQWYVGYNLKSLFVDFNKECN